MVSAKEELCVLAFLFPVLAFVSLAQSNGNSTNFSFPSFGDNNNDQLKYMGNASFNSSSDGYIDLTPSPNSTSGASSNQTADPYSQLYYSIGRVIYREPITVWPATFTTTFTMFVQNITVPAGQKNFNGDGLAFFLVPNDKLFLPESYGSFLGMFDPSTNGNTTNQLAIEFDTFKNEWDPNDNHVGIDINGIESNVTADLGQNGIYIKSGRPIRVQIHYDGWNKTLQIYAAYADRPIVYSMILNRTIELSNTVPRSVYMGFSASTGTSFEIHRILDWNFSSETLPESSLSIGPVRGRSTSKGLKVGLLAGSIVVGAVLLGLSAWFVARKGRRRAMPISRRRFSGELAMIEGRSAASSYAPHRFSYRRLSTATKNFSEMELLGSGGFGSVYRGILEGQDGATALVAVKRISAGSRQGEREFISEISSIGRLRHRNLVQLQGWCHERDELLLVYDYMPNGSLDKIIFRQQGDHHQNQNKNQPLLNWPRRHKILCGLASALLYLHEEWEQRVVHRDIKPSNIMLDGEFNARLGDFGLARLIEHDETNPAVTTMLAGTPGYVAPECGYTGKATAESDVFSFGVVVLEVASGRRVVERKPPLVEGNLVDWIWGLYGQGRVMEAVDPRLDGEFEEEQMKRALILGLACSHPDPQLRPSIRQALQVLINPNEQMMPLPSSRPLAIYVVLPSTTSLDSRSTSYSNAGHAGSASTSSAYTEGASITTSTLHYGR